MCRGARIDICRPSIASIYCELHNRHASMSITLLTLSNNTTLVSAFNPSLIVGFGRPCRFSAPKYHIKHFIQFVAVAPRDRCLLQSVINRFSAVVWIFHGNLCVYSVFCVHCVNGIVGKARKLKMGQVAYWIIHGGVALGALSANA